MKVALYARVSTQDQSPDMQLKDLRTYAGSRGFEIHSEYVDHGFSGTKAKRPALDRLMADARKAKFEGVLVWRFDRFARSTTHLMSTLEEFRTRGIAFMSYNEHVDTGTPMGQMLFTVVAAVAQFEREIIRERVKAGMANAKAKGTHVGRKHVVDVDKALSLRSQGHTIRAIALALGVSIGAVHKALQEGQGVPPGDDLND
jgi:DNA invertase Pin-like site-specific DNA recombinase